MTNDEQRKNQIAEYIFCGLPKTLLMSIDFEGPEHSHILGLYKLNAVKQGLKSVNLIIKTLKTHDQICLC